MTTAHHVASEPVGTSIVKAEPRELVDFLRTRPDTLYAVLDAARDSKVLAFLRSCDQPYQSLYEGPKGEDLAEFAPYLVTLPSTSLAIETLFCEGWGKSWGIYLTSTADFKETRRHFRHFLLVKTEDGRELYFRFYDPRVLRVFLPTCDARESAAFFGPVRLFVVESQNVGEWLEFTPHPTGVASAATPLLRSPAAIEG